MTKKLILAIGGAQILAASRVAEGRKEYYVKQYQAMENDYMPFLASLIEGIPAGRVLDIGPGYGTMGLWLASRGWQVTLMDRVPVGKYLSMDTLETMRALSKKKVVYCERDISFPISEFGPQKEFVGQFDLVTMSSVLPHLKWHAGYAVANVAKMLKPGGVFLSSVIDKDSHRHVKTAFESWENVPKYRTKPASKEVVTVMWNESEYSDLLKTSFENVEVLRSDDSTCLFGRATK